eukprot:TRINITY_DN46065_c0_g1_i2.p1 TRINITY_DN46065_c0_g1~~TRINITY_DN46065_c0_g1_i2.p1  ORF type:complete len:291 (+),score=3.98 TRINITY_DN46065_c0_g1_i2:153-1025(+)
MSPAYHLVKGFLTDDECALLIQVAERQGLQPSLLPERALDPLQLATALSRDIRELDDNRDGVLDSWEVASAVRQALNAPFFSKRDAHAWLTSAVGLANVTASHMPHLLSERSFLSATRLFFSTLLQEQPHKFSRFSQQTPLLWSSLAATEAGQRIRQRFSGLLRCAAETASDLVASPATCSERSGPPSEWADVLSDDEPLQLLSYDAAGHYAPHSDSGWPGHRPATLLVYLLPPAEGGHTCFLLLYSNTSCSRAIRPNLSTACRFSALRSELCESSGEPQERILPCSRAW